MTEYYTNPFTGQTSPYLIQKGQTASQIFAPLYPSVPSYYTPPPVIPSYNASSQSNIIDMGAELNKIFGLPDYRLQPTMKVQTFSVVSGVPLVKRTYEYKPGIMEKEWSVLGFPIAGKDVIIEPGKTYVKQSLVGKFEEFGLPKERYRQISDIDDQIRQILAIGGFIVPGVGTSTAALKGARLNINYDALRDVIPVTKSDLRRFIRDESAAASVLKKKRSVTQIQLLERPKAELEKPVQKIKIIDVTAINKFAEAHPELKGRAIIKAYKESIAPRINLNKQMEELYASIKGFQKPVAPKVVTIAQIEKLTGKPYEQLKGAEILKATEHLKRPVYATQKEQSLYGTFQTQYQVDAQRAKTAVKLMTQAERDLVIAKIKTGQGLAIKQVSKQNVVPSLVQLSKQQAITKQISMQSQTAKQVSIAITKQVAVTRQVSKQTSIQKQVSSQVNTQIAKIANIFDNIPRTTTTKTPATTQKVPPTTPPTKPSYRIFPPPIFPEKYFPKNPPPPRIPPKKPPEEPPKPPIKTPPRTPPRNPPKFPRIFDIPSDKGKGKKRKRGHKPYTWRIRNQIATLEELMG